MDRGIRRGLLAVGVLALAVAMAAAGTDRDDEGDLLGRRAPEVTADFAVNGKPLALADLKGKVVLLDFWAVWCGPCRKTFGHLRDWHETYKDQGLEVIGVTTYFGRVGFDPETGRLEDRSGDQLSKKEERAMLKDFANYFELPYRLMLVPPATYERVKENYGVEGIPQVVLIDKKGKVRLVRVGSDPENARDVKAKIKELLAEEG